MSEVDHDQVHWVSRLGAGHGVGLKVGKRQIFRIWDFVIERSRGRWLVLRHSTYCRYRPIRTFPTRREAMGFAWRVFRTETTR